MMRLENWKLVITENGNLVINGNIYDDENGRWEGGKTINTSRVEEVNFREDYVKTLNNTYKLGRKG